MFDSLLSKVSNRARNRAKAKRLVREERLSIGHGTYGVPIFKTFAHDRTSVRIGKYCSIAGGVQIIMGGNHPTDRISTYPFREKLALRDVGSDGFPSSKGDIAIGHDVWIGTGATILSGVTIGNGAVIGAGCVVSRNVDAYSIVVGNPMRVVRSRFPAPIIEQLQELEWWDFPPSAMSKLIPLLNDATDTSAAITELRRFRNG